MARKRTPIGEVSEINVTPMVDVMLVLLIIMMVITPMLQNKLSVDLAKTHNPRSMPDEEKSDAVVLSVTRDGKVFLNSDQVQLGDITPRVKDLITNKLDKTVFIKSDSRAKYGDVVSVIDNVRAADVEDLGLITEQVQPRVPIAPE